MDAPHIRLVQASDPSDWQAAQDLIDEYILSLGLDLSFQHLDEELSGLNRMYAPPSGAFLLAQIDGDCVGCCALRSIGDTDHLNAAEMKRLYVRPAFRRFGLGRSLTEGILDAARRLGYHTVLLDTLSDMEAARSLYMELGFESIPPYYHNPIAGAHYLKVDL